MKKRVLSLLLVGVTAASLLLGCGGNDNNEGKEEGKDNVSNEDNANSGEEENTDGEKELSTVKILCTNDYSETVKVEDWDKYEISQVFIKRLEELGLRLEVETVDTAALENVISTRMAAGVDLPDLIAYPYNNHEKVLEFAENGLVYSVNELLEEYDADGSIKAYYDESAPGAWESVSAPDGNLYWFSYLLGSRKYVDADSGVSYTPNSPHNISVREDWAEAIGEELKYVYTPDELYELLKKMYDEDANGNGKSDEVVSVEINSFNNGFALGFGLTRSLLCGYFEGEDEVFSNFYHENFPAYIEFMQKLYKDGLYDTASLSDTDALRLENRASAIFGYGSFDYETQLLEIDEDAQYMPIFFELDGDLSNGFHIWNDSNGPNANFNYFVPKAAENPEGVVRLMDFIYTDEYALLDRYGVEGVSYEVDENGIPTSIKTDSTEPQTLWATGLGLKGLPAIVKWGGVRDRHNSSNPASMYEKEEWLYQYYIGDKQYAINDLGYQLALPSDEETAVMERTEAVLTTYATELLTELILGEKSLDDLPKYQAEMEELGLSEYMEVVQARRDRMVGK